MSAITTTPTTVALRPSRLVGLLAAAAVASAAITAGVLVAVDSDTSVHRADEAAATAYAQDYVDGLTALTPDELGWAYRSTPSWGIGLTEQQRAYVEGIMALTPEELGAAFGRHPA